MTTLGRRELARGALSLALSAAGASCARPKGELAVGAVANVTHAPVLSALASGDLARALHPRPIVVRLFRSGPRVMEALLGGAVDVASVGPGPLLIHHARHGARMPLSVLTGIASGGASLVASRAHPIRGVADLRGRRVAVTQTGSTQDISLRHACREAGLPIGRSAGGVSVDVLPASVALLELSRGNIAAAWLPEPWATRAVLAGGARVIDERSLWPGGRFSTALLVCRRAHVARPAIARATEIVGAHVARGAADGRALAAAAFQCLIAHDVSPGPRAAFDAAIAHVDFTADRLENSVGVIATRAHAAGLVPRTDPAALFS